MIRTRPSPRRAGFTLIELMVSAAIVVIIMAILATAFQSGADTLRTLRSSGEMMDQLRAASEVLKRDLRAPHFREQSGSPNNGLRVSDQLIDQYGVAGWDASRAPSGGFFRIVSPAATVEGIDPNFSQSTRADNHLLHFTAVLSGQTDQELFTASVPTAAPQLYTSRAAEIAYFLASASPQGYTNGTPGAGRPNSLPLYRLIRRQRLVATSTSHQTELQKSGDTAGEVISWFGTTPNLMSDLVSPTRRLNIPAVPDTGNMATLNSAYRLGDDILLSNVISFEVRPSWVPGTGVNGPRTFGIGQEQGSGTTGTTPEYPFDTLAPQVPAGEYDTRPSPPAAIRVKAVQIRLRVWDPKMKAARQMTIVQDL